MATWAPLNRRAGRGRGRGRGRRQPRQHHHRQPQYQGHEQEFGDQWQCLNCRMNNASLMPLCEVCSLERGAQPPAAAEPAAADQMRELFTGETALLTDHVGVLRRGEKERVRYVHELRQVLAHGVSMSMAAKTRAAAALWSCGLTDAFDEVLATPELFGVAEMHALLRLLDAPRVVRQLQRRREALAARATAKRGTLDALRARAADLAPELVNGRSVTSSLIKRVRRWAARFPTERLLFLALFFPPQHWRAVADLAHLSPTRDFAWPAFLRVVFGGRPADEDQGECSTVWRALQAPDAEVAAALPALIERHPVMAQLYSLLRRDWGGAAGMSEATKTLLAQRMPLEEALWHFEELRCGGVERALLKRLGSEALGGGGRGNYGKLMERLLTLRDLGSPVAGSVLPHAEERLSALMARFGAQTSARVAVLGDASGSMEVAIRVATILGSVMAATFGAELSFFTSAPVAAPVNPPRSAADVLAVTDGVRARDTTAPAAALWPYWRHKRAVDLFIVVTDEEENCPFNGTMFAPLMGRYLREVNPNARVFLVSFLAQPLPFVGKMRASLRLEGVPCEQFRLDGRRPDLSKLPALLGQVALTLGLPPSGGSASGGSASAGASAGVAAAGAAASGAAEEVMPPPAPPAEFVDDEDEEVPAGVAGGDFVLLEAVSAAAPAVVEAPGSSSGNSKTEAELRANVAALSAQMAEMQAALDALSSGSASSEGAGGAAGPE